MTQRTRPLLLAVLLAFALGACGGGAQQTSDPVAEPEPPPVDDVVEPETPPVPDNILRVYFIDVGQGDGALVVTPNGRTILIDAGPPNAGDDVVATLRRIGVETINLMVTSHAHADHIGGFEDVLDHFPVVRYADPGFPHTSSMYADLLEQVFALNVDAYALTMGQWLQIDDEVEMFVLAPPEPYLGGTRSDVNSNSIVILMRYGEIEILFTGDSEADTERAMLRNGVLEDIDVLKVAHHGGAHSTIARFLEVVQPEYAVISCGEGNSYGHPDPDTVERLEGYATGEVWRTDLVGTIVLETDGTTVMISPESELTSDHVSTLMR